MSRQIKSLATLAPGESVNDFKDRLVKLIPSEVVTAYVTIFGLIKSANQISEALRGWLQWGAFGVLLILTPFYLVLVSNVKSKMQIVFTTIAFVIWVIVVGGPFDKLLGGASGLVGSILLILYTLLIPFFYKG
ncbi:hypothetical protein WSM22_37880 [Cytophagales bacterium WSM2-2]|nr:hypothetical protein WSM22_37880 [Cytophagales bacterium WSM2-2]